MTDFVAGKIKKIAQFDLFKKNKSGKLEAGVFVGRPFYLDYDRALILITDSWKNKAGGIPQGSFLLAFNEVENEISEALLLRVIKPTQLPTHSDVISSMIEYYKDDLQTSGANDQLDSFTRFEFSFSGLECRTLGTYYREDQLLHFGADVENFYSAHNYIVCKPGADALSLIVNYRDVDNPNLSGSIRIGKVRYSSSTRFQSSESEVPVYVQAFAWVNDLSTFDFSVYVLAARKLGLKALGRLEPSSEKATKIRRLLTRISGFRREII